MGAGRFFAPIIKFCKTDFFFHLEDDVVILSEVNLDPIIEVMKKNDSYMVEVILRRGKTNPLNNPKNVIIDGLELAEFDLCSIATGVFNTKLIKDIIDVAGWGSFLNEVKTTSPIAKELGYKSYTLGFDDEENKNLDHVGKEKGYIRGSWKSYKEENEDRCFDK
jgi:hypothetical protein